MTEHWFDRLSQDLARRVSRRQTVRIASLLTAGLALGGAANVGARRKKRRRKDICDKEFRSRKNRNWCRFIRRQCKAPGNGPFCIVEGDPSDPAKVALCCGAGQVCCKEDCCGPFSNPNGIERGRCCPSNPPRRTCIPASWKCCSDNPPEATFHGAPPGSSCCPHDRRGYCAANQFCCAGVGCVQKNTRENCGGCGVHCGTLACLEDASCGCPPGHAICDGLVCYNTETQCCSDGRVLPIGICP